MTVELISVGTELLLGDIVNTNAQFISRELAALGFSVYFQTTVGDNARRLLSAYAIAFERSDMVVATGGLGPTEDDLTKETGAEFFNKKQVLHEETRQKLADFFKGMAVPMADNNLKQAYFPEGSVILKNDKGTAPGCVIEENGKTLIMLPGPPNELIPMFVNEVIPYLKKFSEIGFYSKTLRICGVGESMVEQMLQTIIDNQTNPTVATYAKVSEVHLRVTAAAKSKAEADALNEPVLTEVRTILGDNIYGEDETELEEAVIHLLKQRGKTLALAESCTGGMIASRLINRPGASDVLLEGVVCYGNESKIKRLGVKRETIERYGAVSAETAREMALGACASTGADISVAATGIAGPGGGTDEKPVGLVYIAVCIDSRVIHKSLTLRGDRDRIRLRATVGALDFLRRELFWQNEH